MESEEPKVNLLWKKKLDVKEKYYNHEVKIHDGNIFYISNDCTNSETPYGCIYVLDFKGNIKWKYMPKNRIQSYSLSKNLLAIAIPDEGIEGLNLNGEHLWKYKYKYLIRNIQLSSNYLVFCSGAFVYLLDWDKNNEWKLKWEYDCDKEVGDLEWSQVWDVKIYKENVFAISESYVYCFDIDGNIKWKTKNTRGHEKIKIINEDAVICMNCPYISCYGHDGIVWEFNLEDTFLGGRCINERYIAIGVDYYGDDGKNKDIITYLIDKDGKIINRYVREKIKHLNQHANASPVYTSVSDKYLSVATFDGYVYLFDINGKLKFTWHSSKIDENWRKEHSAKQEGYTLSGESSEEDIVQIVEDGVYGDIYRDYYPISSIDMLEDHIAVLSRNEITIFKIKQQ